MGTPRHRVVITIHRFYSHWTVCTSCSSCSSDFPVLQVRTRPGTPPILNLQAVASHQSRFFSASCRCCTRCSLCARSCNRDIVNLSSRVLTNRQQRFAHRCLNTTNSETRSPIVTTISVQLFVRIDKLFSCCAENEITFARDRLPACAILWPSRLSCTCVNSNLDPSRLSHFVSCIEGSHVKSTNFNFWFIVSFLWFLRVKIVSVRRDLLVFSFTFLSFLLQQSFEICPRFPQFQYSIESLLLSLSLPSLSLLSVLAFALLALAFAESTNVHWVVSSWM